MAVDEGWTVVSRSRRGQKGQVHPPSAEDSGSWRLSSGPLTSNSPFQQCSRSFSSSSSSLSSSSVCVSSSSSSSSSTSLSTPSPSSSLSNQSLPHEAVRMQEGGGFTNWQVAVSSTSDTAAPSAPVAVQSDGRECRGKGRSRRRNGGVRLLSEDEEEARLVMLLSKARDMVARSDFFQKFREQLQQLKLFGSVANQGGQVVSQQGVLEKPAATLSSLLPLTSTASQAETSLQVRSCPQHDEHDCQSTETLRTKSLVREDCKRGAEADDGEIHLQVDAELCGSTNAVDLLGGPLVKHAGAGKCSRGSSERACVQMARDRMVLHCGGECSGARNDNPCGGEMIVRVASAPSSLSNYESTSKEQVLEPVDFHEREGVTSKGSFSVAEDGAASLPSDHAGIELIPYLDGDVPCLKAEDCSLNMGISDNQPEIVVYGVGSIANAEVSRCQLAFAALLAAELGVQTPIRVFDPVLTSMEKRAMLSIGCSALEVDEAGRRCVRRPTVFYMPHCEAHLYDNVLSSNWSADRLEMIAVLGNSFTHYQDRWSVRPSPTSPRPIHLLQVQPHVDELPVDSAKFPLVSAFNDMSWHTFSRQKISSCLGAAVQFLEPC